MGSCTYFNRAVEVAAFLFDIFTTFGLPLILQADNGREFVSSIITELVRLWPTIQIINGRPRHPASQDLVERANGILETYMNSYLVGFHMEILLLLISYLRIIFL